MIIQKLPFKNRDIETIALLRFAAQAQGNLGKVNGIARNIPNQNILLSLLPIQEAQSSSEIENIVTTSDDLYKAQVTENNHSPNIKEVENYVRALKKGFDIVVKEIKEYFGWECFSQFHSLYLSFLALVLQTLKEQ